LLQLNLPNGVGVRRRSSRADVNHFSSAAK
jgi:hypothetical protein